MPYNLPHPECSNDEEWFCNVAASDYIERISLDTKRLGAQAFNFDGEPLGDGYRPVFVKASELEAKGVDLEAHRAARMASVRLTIQRRLETPQSKKGRAMEARNRRLAEEKAARETKMRRGRAGNERRQ